MNDKELHSFSLEYKCGKKSLVLFLIINVIPQMKVSDIIKMFV